MWLVTNPTQQRTTVGDLELEQLLEFIGMLDTFLDASRGMQPGDVRKISGVYWEKLPNLRELH